MMNSIMTLFDFRKKKLFPILLAVHCLDVTKETENTTMLILFKPWKSGKDLKYDNHS